MPPQQLRNAYFRNFKNKEVDQCELNFKLECELSGLGKLDEDISAVRQQTDTVGSLLQHIKNKIHKILQDKYKLSSEESSKYEVPVLLRRERNKLKDENVLKQLIKPGVVVFFEIFDQIYHVIGNAPMVKALELPAVLFANFYVQPCKCYIINTERDLCDFIWYKSKDRVTWVKVGNRYSYKVTANDVDYYMKLVCIPYDIRRNKGPKFEVTSDNVVEPIPDFPECPFEIRHQETVERLKIPKFRVVNYNILSERYTSDFPYCPQRALVMDYRKQLLLRELIGYHADIICLQEVDCRHYVSYFKPELNAHGYYSIYNKKGNRIPEGLALLFNKNVFKQISTEHFVLCNLVEKCKPYRDILQMLKENNEVKELFFRQATSLQITILKVKALKNVYFIIANTHLYYHPDAPHIRLIQIVTILRQISLIKKEFEKNGEKVYVLFCGDFNSRPDTSTFEYIISGKLNPMHEHCLKISENGCDFSHNFSFISACGTPKYTNYTDEFKGCLDYIFIESDKLSVQRIISLPSEEELGNYEGLPNDRYPSDHLALVADLKID